MKKLNTKLFLTIINVIMSIIIIALLVTNIILAVRYEVNTTVIVLLGTFTLVSLFIYGFMIVHTYKTRRQTINSLISSINSIETTYEEVFETGLIIFNEHQNISYISKWMVDEGFDKFLGKNVESLKLDIETIKKQIYNFVS